MEYKEFLIGDLFEVSGSKKTIHKKNILKLDGKHPYVTRQKGNNGINCYIDFDEKYLNPKNTITLALDTYLAHYQRKKYFTGSNVKILKLKNYDLDQDIGLYLSHSLNLRLKDYSWGFTLNTKQLKNLKLTLPVKDDGNIDFEYIKIFTQNIKEKVIQNLEEKTEKEINILTEKLNINIKDPLSEYKEPDHVKPFKVGNLFDVSGSKKTIHKKNILKLVGKHPYVTRQKSNNGINCYIDFDEKYLNPKNTITLALDTYLAHYQRKNYFTGANVKILKLKNYDLDQEIGLYLSHSLNLRLKDYSWGFTLNTKQLKDLELNLPANEDGTVNYQYMLETGGGYYC